MIEWRHRFKKGGEAVAPEKLFTVPEAAALLSIAPKTLTDWLRAGKIRGVKVGRSWRVPESAINEVAQSGTRKE
ncbi:MAG: helix-turn-helix domain-containing protein [Aminivibrio sp.]|uniref:helix-turn-helix domain-containing protein n=1 Tax=Aminivibrio sp. TaxID=1872489 RepID=UPI002B2011E8|nr:helix-turn-helix domain-containing protein [Aminivibrio sp.]MEA4951955.1 helix-turn-helix domain-containing protein [Aminivibrio sp.]